MKYAAGLAEHWAISLILSDVVLGCWKDQPTEAAQPERHHEFAGWSLQTWRKPHHQYPVQDPADGHLRYTHALQPTCTGTLRPPGGAKCTENLFLFDVVSLCFLCQCCPQQAWRWTDWTCTVRNTNLSKASSTWPRLESSRFGRKTAMLCKRRTSPTQDWGVIGWGEGRWYIPCVYTFQDRPTGSSQVDTWLNTWAEPKFIIQHLTGAFNSFRAIAVVYLLSMILLLSEGYS